MEHNPVPISGLQPTICNNLNFMKVIREIPVSKTHSVPLCSLSCLCILFMALVTLLIPFFLVFTEGFFRNSSEVYEQFAINSTYQYYITATSSLTSASFSNLVSDNIVNSDLLISNVKMSQQDTNTDSKNDVFTFEATITQPINKNSSVTSITVLLFFKAVSSSVSTTAIAMYNFKGSKISNAISTGHLQLVQNQIINTTSNNTDYTSNPFVSNYYNLEATFDSYYQQATFFSKVSNQFVLNQHTPEASVKIMLNLGDQQKMIVQEGVFEQIQWSWCYYFPLAFVLGYFSVLLLNLMLKYGIIESRVRSY